CNVLHLPAAVACEQGEQALVLQIAAEQCADPGARDAERKAGMAVGSEHENVAQQVPDVAGLDRAAIGRPLAGAFAVPIGEIGVRRRMLHDATQLVAATPGTVLSQPSRANTPLTFCRKVSAASMPEAEFGG